MDKEDKVLLKKTVRQVVSLFLSDKVVKRELYLYEVPGTPPGKVVRITVDFVSEAKLKNVSG